MAGHVHPKDLADSYAAELRLAVQSMHRAHAQISKDSEVHEKD